MASNLRGMLFALLAFALYATQDALIKALGGSYAPIQIIFFSVLFGVPLATLQMIRETTPDTLRPRNPLLVGLRSAGIILGGVGGFTAFTLLPLAQVYALIFAAPLLVTVLSVPVLGERIGWHRGGAVVLGLMGVLVALRPGASAFGLGHAAALLTALCVALVAVITRRIGTSERSVVLVLYPMLGNLVLLGAALPLVYRPMPAVDLGMMAAVAVFAWAAALAMIQAHRKAEAGLVAPMQYSQMLWAVLYGALFFGERPDGWTLAGTALIVLSGIYIVLRERRGGHSAQKPVLHSAGRAELGLIQKIMPRRGR